MPSINNALVPRNTPILIAGFGSIGRRHFRNLKALGYTNFLFYRTRQGTVDDFETAEYFCTSDLDDALRRVPRIAIISNPSARHIEVALRAAQAQCDLFIEKPLSHSLAGCQELLDIANEHRLVTMVGCQFRFHPLLLKLRRHMQAGALGRLVGARAEWGEYLPQWHPWEDYRQSYSARSDLGGGVILTLIHPLDYMFWLFGPIERVCAATCGIKCLATDAEEDWAEITLSFGSGVIGHVHLDYLQQPPVHQLAVWGETGSAVLDYHAQTLHFIAASEAAAIEQLPSTFERNTMFRDEMCHFLDCVGRRHATDIPLEEGIAVLDVALRAKASAQEAPARV